MKKLVIRILGDVDFEAFYNIVIKILDTQLYWYQTTDKDKLVYVINHTIDACYALRRDIDSDASFLHREESDIFIDAEADKFMDEVYGGYVCIDFSMHDDNRIMSF